MTTALLGLCLLLSEPSEAPVIQRPRAAEPTATARTVATRIEPDRAAERPAVPITSAPTTTLPVATAGAVAPRSMPAIEPAPGLHREAAPQPTAMEHSGFVVDLGLGTQGCTRKICAGSSAHDAAPGVRLAGFIGANLGGHFEVGAGGSWGTLTPRLDTGVNVLSLYGVPDDQLARAAKEMDVAVDDLIANEAKSDAFRVGPVLRGHFPARGRVGAYVGAGVGYARFRTRYETAAGKLRLAFHGFDVPLHAGVQVYLARRVAFAVQADYQWTHFMGLRFHQSGGQMGAPVGTFANGLDAASLQKDLPHVWAVTAGVRLRR